jgi:hypothetical protein
MMHGEPIEQKSTEQIDKEARYSSNENPKL